MIAGKKLSKAEKHKLSFYFIFGYVFLGGGFDICLVRAWAQETHIGGQGPRGTVGVCEQWAHLELH